MNLSFNITDNEYKNSLWLSAKLSEATWQRIRCGDANAHKVVNHMLKSLIFQAIEETIVNEEIAAKAAAEGGEDQDGEHTG